MKAATGLPRALAALLAAALVLPGSAWLLSGPRDRIAQQLPRREAAVAALRLQAAEAGRLQVRPPVPALPLDEALARAEGLARRAGLPAVAAGLRRAGNDALQLEAAVPFDALVAWLGQVQAATGLRLETGHFESAPEPGIVRAQLTLSAATDR